jgi:hypothetical protein
MIDELERCQNLSGNGYISGVPNGKKIWKEISDGNIRASAFGLNDRWVPLYNIHKIYSGLRDAYWYADSEKAKKCSSSLPIGWRMKFPDFPMSRFRRC